MNTKKTIFNPLSTLLKTNLSRKFTFLYDLLRLKPSFSVINITDNCCFKCIMCDQGESPGLPKLSTGEWKDVLAQLKENGINEVIFSGGEPFLREDLIEILYYARKLKLSCGIMTNGYLLNRPVFDRLINLGVNNVAISIGGEEEEFDASRGIKGAYAKVMDSCRLLSAYKQNKLINGYLFFTLTKSSLASYRSAIDSAIDLRLPLAINLFDFTPYFFKTQKDKKDEFWIGENGDLSKLKELQKDLITKKSQKPQSVYHTYSEVEYFRRYFSDPLQKHMPCVVSQSRLGIDSRGNVYGGCWSMRTFGNLSEKPLKEIISSREYREAHKQMFFKKCPGCSCGYPNNLRYHLPTLMKEAAFRMFPTTRKNIWR